MRPTVTIGIGRFSFPPYFVSALSCFVWLCLNFLRLNSRSAMSDNEQTASPPLNNHAWAAQAQQRHEKMLSMMLEQIENLTNQVAALSKKDTSITNDETEVNVNQPTRSISAQRQTNKPNMQYHENDVDDETSSCTTSTSNFTRSMKLPIKPPPQFTMTLSKGQKLTDKIDELAVFLEKLEVFYESFESNNNVKLSLNEKINHLMSIVDDAVFTSIKAVKNRLIASNERIESIEQLFEDVSMLCQTSEMDTAAQLDEIKQDVDEKVETYFVRFDRLHNRAIREGITNRDVSVLWFVNGLKPAIRRQVKLAIKVNGLISGSPSVKQALNKCFGAAKAFESDASTNEQPAWRSRPVQSINQSTSQAQPRVARSVDAAPLSRDEKVKHFMKKYSMTAEEVERHWAKNLCFACHSNNHSASDTGCPKRMGRFNMTSMESVDEAGIKFDQAINGDAQSKN